MFCHVYAEEEDEGGNKVRLSLFGAEAMRYRLDMCSGQQSGHQDPVDMTEFRTFKWMLSSEEATKVDEWTRNTVVSSKERLLQSRQKAFKDLEKEIGNEKRRRQGENAASF